MFSLVDINLSDKIITHFRGLLDEKSYKGLALIWSLGAHLREWVFGNVYLLDERLFEGALIQREHLIEESHFLLNLIVS